MTIEIQFATAKQVEIAEALWEAETTQEVDSLLVEYGREGYVVRDMILAAKIDEVQDTDLAEQVIERIRNLG